MERSRRRLLKGLLATPALAATGSCRPDRDALVVDDISRLNATRVASIFRPASVPALAEHLATTAGPVSIAGGRYSMGGQTLAAGAVQLEMRSLNRPVWLDIAARRVRVQAGMRWRELQDLIDPHDLSVRTMQSYANFTIGGSVGVNCHGRYVGHGALVNSVRSLQLLDASGAVHELSRERQPELFGAVFGGYGGLGVVTEVELELDRNTRIRRQAERVPLADYAAFFRERIAGRQGAVLHNADLAPPRFDAPLAVTWLESDHPLTEPRRLVPRRVDYSREQNLLWAVSELPGSARLRERELDHRLRTESPVVWRNYEASLDTASLEPRTRAFSTYLLQEYFVPVAEFMQFARGMARILAAHEVNALNVSIRHAPPDTTSLLRWAPVEVFSFVIYYKQRTTRGADAAAGKWTRELVDLVLACGGRHYLPYRLHATRLQFEEAYGEAARFAAIKRQVDPEGRFRNRLLDAYLR